MRINKKIGLTLSGGGYRAAAFHLGTLRKLRDLNILNEIDNISTVSGGSIAGAYYMLNRENFDNFYINFKQFLTKISIKLRILFSIQFLLVYIFFITAVFLLYYALNFSIAATTSIAILVIVFILFYLHLILPSTRIKMNIYDRHLFKNKKITDLDSKPILIINSTNLQTGTIMTFTRDEVVDNSYGFSKFGKKPIKLIAEKFSLSQAVGSSSAVPFAFKPFSIKKDFFENEEDYKIQKPCLVDGGLYDNQGLYKLSKGEYQTDIIICSDASCPYKDNFYIINPYFVLRRTTSILMKRIRAFQFSENIFKKLDYIEEIAYFSIDWNYEDCLNGFFNALKYHQIRKKILDYHNIPEAYLVDVLKYKEEIINYIKLNIKYNEIIADSLSISEVAKISSIKTDLHSLSESDFELLVKHGSVLTELLVKLYCPTLIPIKNEI